MKTIKHILTVMLVSVAFASCEDLFEPANENHLGFDRMYSDPTYADGVLQNAYSRLPMEYYSFNDVATDDAVSNDASNVFRKMCSAGNWSAQNNPVSRWDQCRMAIQYINLFLANAEKVEWNSDEKVNALFLQRYQGEAYALRALHTYYLLQAHGGVSKSGSLLGVPMLTQPEDVNSDFNANSIRSSFADSYKGILDDIAKAEKLLPLDYVDVSNNAGIPTDFTLPSGIDYGQYNRTMGVAFAGKMTRRIAYAVRAQAALLASSPAFAVESAANAANYAAQVLELNGWMENFDPTGNVWYKGYDAVEGSVCPKEVLWRTAKSAANSEWETANYAPELWGNGRINPTQNLVNAFPTINGKPIDKDPSYDAKNPYENRDPRLAEYVLYNGQTEGANGAAVNTQADGSDKNGLNKEQGKSTRTGYYLRKLLRQDINLDPTVNGKGQHYVARIRYTELYLAYAEAANEADGATSTQYGAKSAKDVIKAIRERAGICVGTTDEYLDECATNKDKMRELIRNERRLELCFEGHRFWDLRRWNLPLTESAMGVRITGDANKNYEEFQVETRDYKDYMIYGPIPYNECQKFNSLEQNKGW